MIYKCVPQEVNRIWGSLPATSIEDEPVGEIWWFFEDTVLVDSFGNEVMARSFFRKDSFPIIVKTLHTAKDLSVQVHPGKTRLFPLKDETWVVLEGSGSIKHGVKDGITKEQFKDSVESGLVEDILLEITGEPGLVIDLPAGTIHALGSGLTVLEVQVNCTTTYRLWDYNRLGLDGKLRELHIEKGLKSVNWKNFGRAKIVNDTKLYTEYYSIKEKAAGSFFLKPFEIAFIPEDSLCFIADSSGGVLESSKKFWLIGIKI